MPILENVLSGQAVLFQRAPRALKTPPPPPSWPQWRHLLARLAGLFALFALCATVTACSGYRQPPAAFHEVLMMPYQVDSGDRLRITVFDQADLSNVYEVDQSGRIDFPLIGQVAARGSTTSQIDAEITKRLGASFLRSPDVAIEIDQYRPFFVMGEVGTPGQYTFVAGMTVQQAVAISGGYTIRANQSYVSITRTINGEIMTGTVVTTDPVRPGDTIHVHQRLF